MCGKYVVAQEKLKSSQQTGALSGFSREAFLYAYNGLHHKYNNDSREYIAPPSSWNIYFDIASIKSFRLSQTPKYN